MAKKLIHGIAVIAMVIVIAGCNAETVNTVESGKELTVYNNQLSLRFDKTDNTFQIASKLTEDPFVKRGLLNTQKGKLGIEEAVNEKWGKGKAVNFISESGNTTKLSVYPDIPFVFVDSYICNNSSEAVTYKDYKPVSFELDMPKNDVKDKAFGTFGLDDINGKSKHGILY